MELTARIMCIGVFPESITYKDGSVHTRNKLTYSQKKGEIVGTLYVSDEIAKCVSAGNQYDVGFIESDFNGKHYNKLTFVCPVGVDKK